MLEQLSVSIPSTLRAKAVGKSLTIFFRDCVCDEGFIRNYYSCDPNGCSGYHYDCPANSYETPGLPCHQSFDDCTCVANYEKRNGQCLPTPCQYECPAHSTPKDGVDCLEDFNDCICDMGYEKRNGACQPCTYECPANSMKIVHGCASNFGDCECIPPFINVGSRCRQDPDLEIP